ncbi:hypothetical protein [Thermus amyloliquefaciens]|uniref:hypothetical protein n=2 Tax=Thermus amyloliquefaciens TaxID=1449080 RepID=UPI00056EF894|nr:hypothetical protein [Thermus amyloliquefaciens]
MAEERPHPLVHLACDGVMPRWLAEVYGVPRGAGHRRVVHLPPTPWSRRAVRLEVVGWSRGEVALAPKALRHALATAVARYRLRARPDLWDSLAVRSSRRSLRGREWARWLGREGRLKGVPRPDAEVWDVEALAPFLPRFTKRPDTGWPHLYSPVAVEVDMRLSPEAVWARWEAWLSVYSGVLWFVPSEERARAVGSLLRRWLEGREGLSDAWRVYVIGRWWDGQD